MSKAQDDSREAPALSGRVGLPRSVALFELVERSLAGMGYELVELERAGGGLLRVTLDHAVAAAAAVPAPVVPALSDGEPRAGEPAAPPTRHIGIEDCERVSRHLTQLFAVEDVDYDRLEVASPGMDRPLRGARDFARFIGAMAKVQLFSPEQGRRRLRGRLLGVVAAAAPTGALVGDRVRMQLLPEAPPPPLRGARRHRTAKAAPGATIDFALAEVEKARLAPEWEFDRTALACAAAPAADLPVDGPTRWMDPRTER